jgi:hypothetical protein
VASRPPAPRLDAREREALLERLRSHAQEIAAAFGLTYLEILPARADARSFYGLCDSEGRIRIRLNHVKTGRPLRFSSLVNTLCHELAHLKYFNHGPAFQDYYRRILEWARARGIYRPGRRPEPEVSCQPPLSGPKLRETLSRLRGLVGSDTGIAPAPRSRRRARGGRPVQLRLFGDGV